MAGTDCGRTWFFTPGPDGGGTYPVLVQAAGETTGYRLLIRLAKPDDIGPGSLLQSGERRSESVSNEDPLDLYRFDVPGRSDVRVMVDATKDLGIRLLNGARQLDPERRTRRRARPRPDARHLLRGPHPGRARVPLPDPRPRPPGHADGHRRERSGQDEGQAGSGRPDRDHDDSGARRRHDARSGRLLRRRHARPGCSASRGTSRPARRSRSRRTGWAAGASARRSAARRARARAARSTRTSSSPRSESPLRVARPQRGAGRSSYSCAAAAASR